MHKSKNSKEPAALPMGLSGIMAPQVTHFWQAQDKTLNEISAFAARWIDRRQKAMSDVLKEADQTRDSDQGFGATPATLLKWQMTTMEVMAEDVNDWLALWSTCSRLISTSEIEAECEIAGLGDTGKRADKLPTRIPV
jgi:hypothetical protein